MLRPWKVVLRLVCLVPVLNRQPVKLLTDVERCWQVGWRKLFFERFERVQTRDVEQTEPIWTTKVWYYTAHVVLVWWVGWWQWSTELSRLDNFECTCLAESPSFRSWASMHVNREFGQGCHGFVLQTARVGRFLLRMPERMWPEVCDRQPWGFCVRVEPMDLQVTDPQDPHGLGTKMAKICENHHQRSQRSQQCCQSQLKNAHPHLPEPSPDSSVSEFCFWQVEILQGPLGTPTGHDFDCCPSGRPGRPDLDSFCTPRVTQGGRVNGNSWERSRILL